MGILSITEKRIPELAGLGHCKVERPSLLTRITDPGAEHAMKGTFCPNLGNHDEITLGKTRCGRRGDCLLLAIVDRGRRAPITGCTETAGE
jgi:hypothetical protein